MTRPAGARGSLYFDYPHFAFSPPPELTGARARHAVAVVGAGPVGLCTALALARQGVRVVLLDDKASVNDGSRAICIARHSLEGLQQLGVAEAFLAKALPWTHGTSFYKGVPVFRLEMPHDEHQRFHPMYNLQQQYIEQFLVDAVAAEPLVETRWQSRVTAVQSREGGVALGVATAAGDYRLEADYVVAADGARSAVRRALGLELHGEAHEGRYVIVDVRLPSTYPTERRAFFDCPGNPGKTVLVHRQPDDIWRIDYQLDDGEDEAQALAEDTIRARVAAIIAMLGETEPWALEWWSVYKAYTLCLDDYRHGRVLFCGDAAHLVPIFGVRGLNSGLADAQNLAWKLAAVIRGEAPDALLDSYSPERRGATLDIFAQASKSTRFMSPPTRGHRLLRDAALGLARDHAFARRLLDPRQSQPYTYADSVLSTPDDGSFTAGPAPGAPLVNRRLRDGSFLLDHLGAGFTWLHFDTEVPERLMAIAARLRLGAAGLRVLRLDPSDRALAGAYDARPGTCYLVRPDRHVSARWRAFDRDAAFCAWRRGLGGDAP
ncbi:MAG: FAD-dependent oxidoreductase [Gammaproteobacteria bacterium]|nr:FAD-dependent oxidoreductase [Gammaproteobacteria bacterium]